MYRFRVEYNFTTLNWVYSIKDLSTGIQKTKPVASHWHNADGAWWGAETHESGSTQGPSSAAGQIQQYSMQYWRTVNGYWSITTNDVVVRNIPPASWQRTSSTARTTRTTRSISGRSCIDEEVDRD